VFGFIPEVGPGRGGANHSLKGETPLVSGTGWGRGAQVFPGARTKELGSTQIN